MKEKKITILCLFKMETIKIEKKLILKISTTTNTFHNAMSVLSISFNFIN